ncbi:Short C-terminal domain [Schinkia azotoformans MEV2011]|uniref:Short C-terminal domain n=1 Tax=Schinkia azotoformans MEV2011 TaxID=1348973 RepID=A0A072NJH8_SCHAZ|nr:SHOCT domain-containing protein [Schinkia azotoformans]KEF37437.1 Short C-terminal domain [Schinkia azotoformans MEV2011]MEC1697712.1 SHOCT domain-containing protein [Schinkia azotoformans]MEC1726179.1 SHOCT domain-containing protein [Schinkia azotoformans]MEC1780026.1 SHOCT domain-containing protein [Schinkia azotoformans]MED4330895.1 SHOCT domain-containing protein [Schinkia azotoformans]
MMNWFDHCLGFQGGGMMMLGMFIFWGLLIFLGVYFLKTLQNGKDTKSGSHINILKERLARGEITEDEFEHLNQTLLK